MSDTKVDTEDVEGVVVNRRAEDTIAPVRKVVDAGGNIYKGVVVVVLKADIWFLDTAPLSSRGVTKLGS